MERETGKETLQGEERRDLTIAEDAEGLMKRADPIGHCRLRMNSPSCSAGHGYAPIIHVYIYLQRSIHMADRVGEMVIMGRCHKQHFGPVGVRFPDSVFPFFGPHGSNWSSEAVDLVLTCIFSEDHE